MRKFSLVLSAVAVTGLTVIAQAAPESVIWFDVRDNVGTGQSITAPTQTFQNGQGEVNALNLVPNDGPIAELGQRGWGQVLRINPVLPGNQHIGTATFPQWPNFDGDQNSSTGDLWMYMDVLPNQDAPAGTNDVISSLGLDIGITANNPASQRYTFTNAVFSWQINDPTVPVNFGMSPAGTANIAPGGSTSVKYVKVPVSGASVYATAGGFTIGGPYRIAKLSVTGAVRNANAAGCTYTSDAPAGNRGLHNFESSYKVNLSVNNLLVTRTFSTGGNATPEERVSFGYTGGAVESDVSGNTVGGAGVRDALIQVRMKGDGNGNGSTSTPDVNFFLAAQATNGGLGNNITQAQAYCFDRNGNGAIQTNDTNMFLAFQTAAGSCP